MRLIYIWLLCTNCFQSQTELFSYLTHHRWTVAITCIDNAEVLKFEISKINNTIRMKEKVVLGLFESWIAIKQTEGTCQNRTEFQTGSMKWRLLNAFQCDAVGTHAQKVYCDIHRKKAHSNRFVNCTVRFEFWTTE